MTTLYELLKIIWRLNYKTIRFNFTYLPFSKAIKFPFFVSGKTVLSKLKGNVIIEGGVRTGMIRIGYGDIGIFDKEKSRTILKILGTIVFHGQAELGHGSKIIIERTGKLVLGKEFMMTAESTLLSRSNITFGNNCLVSWEVLIMDTDLHNIKNSKGIVTNPSKEITFGDHVWVGCRCLILKGAQIPNGAVIAASSIITSQLFGDNNLFGGNPTRIIKENIKWEY